VPRLVAATDVDTVVRGLVGVVDVDGGPSDEQLRVLDAVVVHLFERDDIELEHIVPLGPEETATRLADAAARRRFGELMFTLEACRHPLSRTQVESCERYAAALGSSPEEVHVLRVAIDDGVAHAAADFDRFFSGMVEARSEPRFRARDAEPPHLDPELVAIVNELHRLPEGTLGWCLADFYATHGFAVPGSEITPNTYLYFDHDNIHVISGVAPTGAGEIALGGFQMCMDDNPASTFAFFSPLVLHETGITAIDDIVATGSTLSRPDAAELLGSEMARGSRTTGDFAWIDHLELAPLPLAEIREHFGVERPLRPDDGHHIYW
jgi:hypothetical protein